MHFANCFAVFLDDVSREEAGVFHFFDGGEDLQSVVELCGTVIFNVDMFDNEDHAELLFHFGAFEADGAKEFTARALREVQVIGVIDYAACVGVFVVYSDINFMCVHGL
jgi:hypothetical protein